MASHGIVGFLLLFFVYLLRFFLNSLFKTKTTPPPPPPTPSHLPQRGVFVGQVSLESGVMSTRGPARGGGLSTPCPEEGVDGRDPLALSTSARPKVILRQGRRPLVQMEGGGFLATPFGRILLFGGEGGGRSRREIGRCVRGGGGEGCLSFHLVAKY